MYGYVIFVMKNLTWAGRSHRCALFCHLTIIGDNCKGGHYAMAVIIVVLLWYKYCYHILVVRSCKFKVSFIFNPGYLLIVRVKCHKVTHYGRQQRWYQNVECEGVLCFCYSKPKMNISLFLKMILNFLYLFLYHI